jgi:HAD superfamily hydrolase (TIGR01459 family)
MKRIRSVREVAGEYDAVLCDVWGVLHDGERAYPGVGELLTGLRAAGTTVVLVSNVPTPGHTIPERLRRLGLPDEAWDAIVTSGDVTRTELARRSPGPLLRLGRDTDTALWEGLGLQFVDIARAKFLAIAGLRGPQETPEDYQPQLRAARARDLELLCANPDLKVPHGQAMAWCAGAVAWEYALLGGRVVMSGKPHAPIYARARAEVDRVARHPVPPARILAIGDGISTDIVGANRVGLDSLFVATGINGAALLGNGNLDVERAAGALEAAHARATYVIERLA